MKEAKMLQDIVRGDQRTRLARSLPVDSLAPMWSTSPQHTFKGLWPFLSSFKLRLCCAVQSLHDGALRCILVLTPCAVNAVLKKTPWSTRSAAVDTHSIPPCRYTKPCTV